MVRPPIAIGLSEYNPSMADLRCICLNLSLFGLKAYAKRHGITTFDELSRTTLCGTGCGSCRPYIEEMLRTGVVPQTENVPRLDSAALFTDLSAMFPDEADDQGQAK